MREWIDRIVRTFAPPPVTAEEIARFRDLSAEGAAQVRARDEEVQEVTNRLLRQREQNHFGPLIWAALRGEPDV
ncbi:DUF7620 family protein [Nocardiopsis alba]|uniref:DUF7620 family protein n=1 Tax=Nocardiopsis alba TaxID=53437 RepID=UPI003BA19190